MDLLNSPPGKLLIGVFIIFLFLFILIGGDLGAVFQTVLFAIICTAGIGGIIGLLVAYAIGSIVALIVATIVEGANLPSTSQLKPGSKPKPMNSLQAYYKNALQSGMKSDEIIQKLKAVGWTDEAIRINLYQ